MKKLLEKTEKSGQLSQEVRKCIQSASTLDDIETLAAQVPFINDKENKGGKHIRKTLFEGDFEYNIL